MFVVNKFRINQKSYFKFKNITIHKKVTNFKSYFTTDNSLDIIQSKIDKQSSDFQVIFHKKGKLSKP